jgi:hypothetical protein
MNFFFIQGDSKRTYQLLAVGQNTVRTTLFFFKSFPDSIKSYSVLKLENFNQKRA